MNQESLKRKGMLLCFVGPAGSGKTTLGNMLLQEVRDMHRSLSITSRPSRPGEKQGECYSFVSREDFLDKVKNGLFFEYEETHGHLYGTLQDPLLQSIHSGEDILFIVDIRGALNFKKHFPLETVIVCVIPPSLKELERRLVIRDEDDQEKIVRVMTAKKEIELFFLGIHDQKIDYFLVNDSLDNTFKELLSIVIAERKRPSRLLLQEWEAQVKKDFSIFEDG